MLKEFVDRLVELKRAPQTLWNDRLFQLDDYKEVLSIPYTGAQSVHSLSGVADFCNMLAIGGSKVFVLDPVNVTVVGPIIEDRNRGDNYLIATPAVNFEGVNCHNLELEAFIVYLQTNFVIDDAVETLITIFKKIDLDDETSFQDDGFTTQVTVRDGAKLAIADIPNPIELRPYRTFPEIPQPASPFLLRVKKSGKNLYFTLHDVQDQKWRIEALADIKTYLTNAIKSERKIPVIA